MTTLAIVLTYCAPLELPRSVRAVLDQDTPPAEILVIDNAGTPRASESLAQVGLLDAVTLLEALENTGPAGGYALGLERFLASEHDTAWVMDDDMIPDVSCLSALHAELLGHGRTAAVFPTQLDPEGRIANRPGWCGVLLHRRIVATAGLPRRELFWWAEDTEYLQWRIPRAGFPVLRSSLAIMRHVAARETGARPAWKYYYETRNSTYYRLYVQGEPRHAWRLGKTLLRLGGQALLRERSERRKKVLSLLRGLRDGILGRLGKTVDP